jgi:hypothetical protein
MSPLTTAPTVLIRAARGSDGPALERLAALDSQRVPAGPMLVAEQDDEIVAALDLGGGARIADPFRRTAGLLELLSLHAARRAERPRRQRRRILRPATV